MIVTIWVELSCVESERHGRVEFCDLYATKKPLIWSGAHHLRSWLSVPYEWSWLFYLLLYHGVRSKKEKKNHLVFIFSLLFSEKSQWVPNRHNSTINKVRLVNWGKIIIRTTNEVQLQRVRYTSFICYWKILTNIFRILFK